jgi:hypothetical protein
MHSVPKRTRKEDRRNRYEQYGEGHPYCHLPDIDEFQWVANAWQEAGMVGHGMSGAVPLSWAEIESYHSVIGKPYSSWALCVLREMSEAYCKWQHKGSEQKDIADDVPYIKRDEKSLEQAAKTVKRSLDNSAKMREAI